MNTITSAPMSIEGVRIAFPELNFPTEVEDYSVWSEESLYEGFVSAFDRHIRPKDHVNTGKNKAWQAQVGQATLKLAVKNDSKNLGYGGCTPINCGRDRNFTIILPQTGPDSPNGARQTFTLGTTEWYRVPDYYVGTPKPKAKAWTSKTWGHGIRADFRWQQELKPSPLLLASGVTTMEELKDPERLIDINLEKILRTKDMGSGRVIRGLFGLLGVEVLNAIEPGSFEKTT